MYLALPATVFTVLLTGRFMDALTLGLTILTAMITPAVLISGCGTLVLSTSSRLGRIIDHVRDLADSFEQLAHEESTIHSSGGNLR